VTDVSTNAAGPLPSSLYVGIDTCSHANDATTATVFLNYYTGVYANYNSAYVAPTNATAPRLSASLSGNKVTISWAPAGGTLQSSPKVGTGATWTAVPNATNPMTITLSGTGEAFYRVKP
jgi:hypothetical protein